MTRQEEMDKRNREIFAEECKAIEYLTDSMIDAVSNEAVDMFQLAVRAAPPIFEYSNANEQRLIKIGIAAAMNIPRIDRGRLEDDPARTRRIT